MRLQPTSTTTAPISLPSSAPAAVAELLRPVDELLVVMGVSGSGKSTVCTTVLDALRPRVNMHVSFYEGDDFHSAANKAKMARSEPLTEEDRKGWLDSIVQCLGDSIAAVHPDDKRQAVRLLACSALRREHRDVFRTLRSDTNHVKFFHLQGAESLIEARLKVREQGGGHFMPARLLPSQIATLQPPNPVDEPDVTPLSLTDELGMLAAPNQLARVVIDSTFKQA